MNIRQGFLAVLLVSIFVYGSYLLDFASLISTCIVMYFNYYYLLSCYLQMDCLYSMS